MFFVINKNKVVSILLLSVIVVTCIVIYSSVAIPISISGKKLLPIYNVGIDEKKVAITLNCAWNDSDIDSILDTLDKYNTKVTFFVVGDWVHKYPESLKKIYDEGHEIGNHSDTHPHVNKLDIEENINEIKNCSQKVNDNIGIHTTLYRGPYGEYNNTVIESVHRCNHIAIQWNIDTLDYQGLDKDEMWSRIEKKIIPGSIILMHNGTKHTAEALPYIIEKLLNMKYEIVKVSDILIEGNTYIDINGIQKKVE